MSKRCFFTVAAFVAAAALCCMKPNADEECIKGLQPFDHRRISHRGLHDIKGAAPENPLDALGKRKKGSGKANCFVSSLRLMHDSIFSV